MPYYDVANLVTVTKTNMIDEMPCDYGTLRTTGVRIRHQVSRRACTEVSAALEVSRRPAQRSQQLQNLTILIVKSRSILNAPPSLQVLSGARANALAESESTLQSSRGGWEHLEVLRSTGEGYRSVWEVCVWLPDRITFCWCAGLSTGCSGGRGAPASRTLSLHTSSICRHLGGRTVSGRLQWSHAQTWVGRTWRPVTLRLSLGKVFWSLLCPWLCSWSACCTCRPPTSPYLLIFPQRFVSPYLRLRCMAALSLCFRLRLGPHLPDCLLLRFRGCRSFPGPSGSLLRCRGRGDSALFCWSASPAAALRPAPGVPSIKLRLVSRWRLPPS